jgi:hypothetical protein
MCPERAGFCGVAALRRPWVAPRPRVLTEMVSPVPNLKSGHEKPDLMARVRLGRAVRHETVRNRSLYVVAAREGAFPS